jgi:PAS domain S-box-containing protein
VTSEPPATSPAAWPSTQQSAAQGARPIFKRFILVAVGLNALVGLGVVAFDVADSIWTTRDFLRREGQLVTRITTRLRRDLSESDEALVRSAAELTGHPMALVSRGGDITFSSSRDIPRIAPRIYGGKPTLGAVFTLSNALGELSGAWVLSPFSEKHDLLVVVTRRPEDEGLMEYMTTAAALTGLGLVVSFVIMLGAANWMLRRPLSSLVSELTRALTLDVHRRKLAEERAVAARMQAEEHLAFRENLIEASAQAGIVATDAEGLIQIFNHAAEGILGCTAAEVVGRLTLSELGTRCQPIRQPGAFPPIDVVQGEVLIVDQQGNEHLLDVKRNDIRDAQGNKRGLLMTFTDVTERRRLEVELQLNELRLVQSSKLATLGEMATGMAHELSQPLNNIELLATRLKRRLGGLKLSAEDQGFCEDKLSKVETQVERAGRIIDHLRAFGRERARTMSSVEVRESVEGVMVFLGEQLRVHGIEVELQLPDGLPQVVADEAQLEQVLMNLLVNARDALDEYPPSSSREKKITISAARTTLASGAPGVAISVTDTGPGIPREIRERVFDPFFTTKEVGKGTGLGLSISYGLVRDFGGTLEVESQVGQGTTFTIQLREANREPA